MTVKMRTAVFFGAVALGVLQVGTTMAAFGWVPI
jgi:hypothetical protein